MPELPEVETTRRALEPVMGGQRITLAGVHRDGLRWPFPQNMAARLSGATVTALRRRSKYLLIDLDRGETLIVHLGMSGSLQVALPENQTARGKHDHVVLQLASGTRVTFNDPRRFGAMDLTPTERLEAHKLLVDIGPEPLGNKFDALYLAGRFNRRRAPIKAALLDQRTVAGLGNIYVSEALWRAGISPRRKAGNLRPAQLELLVSAIRDVLDDAITAGGSSIRDFRHGEGELGYFQHRFAVYDRAGAPCRKFDCTGIIARVVQSGRSSYYCNRCQR